MSIKSDRWIKRQCSERTYVFRINREAVVASGMALNYKANDVIVPELDLPNNPHIRDIVPELLEMKIGDEKEFDDAKVTVLCQAAIPMITPFTDKSVNTLLIDGAERKIPSYGLSSYGYDISLGRNFKIIKKLRPIREEIQLELQHGYTTVPGEPTIVDMLSPPENLYEELVDRDSIVIPPHGMVLGVSKEHITMPRNVTATCMAKSTLARMGILADVTPLEAGWSGWITLEIFNKTPNHVRLYSGIGIMQLVFHESEQCDVSYADRGGKYMNQLSIPVEARL